MKRTDGMLIVNFEKKPSLRGTKILSCGRGLTCCSSLRGTNSNKTRYLVSYFIFGSILLNTLKGSRCQPFKAEHIKRYQHRFFNP